MRRDETYVLLPRVLFTHTQIAIVPIPRFAIGRSVARFWIKSTGHEPRISGSGDRRPAPGSPPEGVCRSVARVRRNGIHAHAKLSKDDDASSHVHQPRLGEDGSGRREEARTRRHEQLLRTEAGASRTTRESERDADADATRRTRGSKPESLGDLLNRDSSWEGRFRVRGSEGNSTETRTRWTARRRRRRRTSGMNAGKCFRGDTAARERRRGRRGTRERSIARLGLGRGVSRSDDPRSDPRGSDGRRRRR